MAGQRGWAWQERMHFSMGMIVHGGGGQEGLEVNSSPRDECGGARTVCMPDMSDP